MYYWQLYIGICGTELFPVAPGDGLGEAEGEGEEELFVEVEVEGVGAMGMLVEFGGMLAVLIT